MSAARRFERLVLPHLDAAYNLARWLLADRAAAEDAVQEAALRAFRYFDSAREETVRSWFLGIVRNTCFSHLESTRNRQELGGYDEATLDAAHVAAGHSAPEPGRIVAGRQARAQIDAALRALPPPLREVIVLRELEGLEYAEIARIAAIPVGTVMSRLARARERLRASLGTVGSEP